MTFCNMDFGKEILLLKEKGSHYVFHATKIGEISTPASSADVIVEWKIPNFFSLQEHDGDFYHSPDFSFGGQTWQLVIFPNGCSVRETSGHVDLRLCKYFSGTSIRQAFSLSLKTLNGEKKHEKHGIKLFGGSDSHVFNKFVPRCELLRRRSELVPHDVLTVVYTMKNTSAGSDSESCIAGFSVSPHEKKVLHDFKELFLQKEDCDIIIKVKGSEFPVHRFVLKARSPVFASTFQHNMKENVTGIVEIEDCDPFYLSDFLYFLYCGDVGMISWENVFFLFKAADKYEVLDLRAECLEFMKKNLTVDTFCETTNLALRHLETELIALATDFFVENAEEILPTAKWQTFGAENPTQRNELFLKFVKSAKHSNAGILTDT